MNHTELEAARQYVTERGPSPRLGVVLGSGLGDFAALLGDATSLGYDAIPNMPQSTVSGHAGKLWLGELAGQPVACLQGRAHLYEGHSPERVVFGVRLLAALGVEAVLLTNAAGGIGTSLSPGSLMLIVDQINLTGHNPLVGSVADNETRFCDMSYAYDRGLCQLAEQSASEVGLTIAKGVYAGVLGPSYETPAEVRMLRALGADAVGMSTVMETIALRAHGVKVGAVSLITNLAAGLSASTLSHAEVEATAKNSRKHFTSLMQRWCELILAV